MLDTKNKDIWLCAACKVDNKYSPLKIVDPSGSTMVCPKCGKIAKNFKLELYHLLREGKLSVNDLKT
jgi:rubrerythrin